MYKTFIATTIATAAEGVAYEKKHLGVNPLSSIAPP
jgi:hypothetical protein